MDLIPIIKILFREYQAHTFLGLIYVVWLQIKFDKRFSIYETKNDAKVNNIEEKVNKNESELEELKKDFGPVKTIYNKIIFPDKKINLKI